jgi:hypothetical protein
MCYLTLPQPNLGAISLCPITADQNFERLVVLLLDEGRTPLTHHLPADLADGFVLRSETETYCGLDVEQTTSNTNNPQRCHLTDPQTHVALSAYDDPTVTV